MGNDRLASNDTASVQHAAPHQCPLCHTQATVFFHIQLATRPESKVLLESLLQARHDQFGKVWSGRAFEVPQACDTKTIQRERAHLCFGCALKSIPDLVDRPAIQQTAPPAPLTDHTLGRLSPDLPSPSIPMDGTSHDTTSPAPVTGPRI